MCVKESGVGRGQSLQACMSVQCACMETQLVGFAAQPNTALAGPLMMQGCPNRTPLSEHDRAHLLSTVFLFFTHVGVCLHGEIVWVKCSYALGLIGCAVP